MKEIYAFCPILMPQKRGGYYRGGKPGEAPDFTPP